MSSSTGGNPHPQNPDNTENTGNTGATGNTGESSPSAPQFGGAAAGSQYGQSNQNVQGHQPDSDPTRNQASYGGGAPQYQPATNQGSYQPQGGPGTGQKIKGKPPLWLGIALAIAGPVIGILALIVSLVAVGSAVSDFTNAEAGSSHTLEADQTYWIASGDGSTSVSNCSVFGPGSSSIDVNTNPSTNTSAEANGESWNIVGEFTSDEAGDYSVYCSGLLPTDTYVVEANAAGIVGGVLGLIGGILVGGLIFLVGIVLIIINRVTASRRRREAGAA